MLKTETVKTRSLIPLLLDNYGIGYLPLCLKKTRL